ncbi:MAG: O-antigen ligase family protein [Parcubacteria group bacterium]|nr:O-antigen ligase family protein [Parcubacteria group bacterium]MBI4268472.1 O-antigen ligase family protein [Candidatus Uhrbacteria bacterium]
MQDANQKFITVSRVLLYTSAVLPLVLWPGFTFPYVTIRTVFFRIIIEIVATLAVWLWALGRIRFTNLKQQYFFWIFLGLLMVESIAALFGEAPLASFFGDLERMWGIFTVGHLFLFYVLSRMFFGERQWRVFFHVSLITSIGVSIYGILQRSPDLFGIYLFGAGEGTRIVSTLGNPTYVAMYLLFNIAFALYLLMRTHKGNRARLFYLSVIAIDLYAFTLTDIRGAYLGLLAGAAFAGLAYVFLGRRRMAKQAIGALFVLAALALALGFQFRSSPLVRTVPVLRRVVTISISDSTSQTRFIGWNAAIQGFRKDPLTGVGMENYNILFNEYFPAEYYLLAPTETYFDRAHNQFFNILAESGIIALALYMGFPALVGWYLVRGYRSRRFALGEFLLFGGLSIAYFTYLFFVFDDFHSLLFFAAFLALVEFRYRDSAALRNHEQSPAKAGPITAAVLLVPLALWAIVALNTNVIRAARNTGQAFLTEDIAESLAHYRRAVAVNLIPSENVTLNFVEYLMGLSEKNDQIQASGALKADILAAFSEAEQALLREIKKKPNDAVFYLKLGQLNNTWFLIDDNKERLADAIGYLERARELSPGRIQMYLVLGESYVLAGESERAIEILKQAVELEPRFGATYYYLGRAFLTSGDLSEAYDAIVNKSFIEYGRQPEVTTIAYVLAEELAAAGEYQKMVTVYEHLAKFEPRNARAYSALAIGYVLADRYEDAIRAAQKAAELDPGFAPEAAVFIQAIRDGNISELKQSAF